MSLTTRKRRSAARQMIDLARRRGDAGVVFLPGAAQAGGMHWLARDCGLGVSLNPTSGTLGPDSVTRPAAAWLAAYVESTASTPAAVDGPVGFLSDGEGTVGAELCSNPGGLFSTTAGWATFNGASLSATGGNLVITNGNFGGVVSALATTNGQTYRVVIAVAGGTGSSLQANVLGTVVTLNVGLNPVVVVASTNQLTAYLNSATAGQTLLLSSVSCKPLTGRHATQNSGPNKPVMRRGITNILPYSNDISNDSYWLKSGSTATATKLTPSTANALHRISLVSALTIASGVPYTTAVRASASGYRYLYLNGAASPNVGQATFDLQTGTVVATANGTATITPVGDGSYICAVSATANSTTLLPYFQVNNSPVATDTTFAGDGTSGINMLGQGTFVGTLTAAQILAGGGIPLTTTVAASSSGGGYALQGNGSSTAMSLPGPVVGLTDDCVVIAGMRMDIPSGGGYFMGVAAAGNTATPARAGVLAVSPSNTAAAYWTNDASTFFVSNAGVITPGTPYVMTAVQRSGVAKARINGGAWGNSVNPTGAATLNTAGLFSAQGFQAWNGLIWAPLIFKGTFTDAEIAVLERGVAALCPIPGALRF